MAKVIKYDEIYEKIISFKNINYSYEQVIKGDRRYKSNAILFSMLKDINLVELWQDLKTGNYEIGEYIQFHVYEPKKRWISAPTFRDKIVQFAVHNIIKDVYYPIFISDSYACIDGKGTHRAVDSVQRDLQIAQREFKDPWIVSADVEKFFYTIDREILKRILRKKIKCDKTLWLLDLIIDSSPEGVVGIPLGNVTSQDFANIYMNELDQYAQRFLGIRYYNRYADDVIMVVDGRHNAQVLKKDVCLFLRERLKLKEHDHKTQIFPLSQGVNAYGFKIHPTHKLVRNQSKRGAKRRIKGMDRKLKAGRLTEKDVVQSVNSWLGHARHSNSYNLAKKIFKSYPYINIEGDDYFGNRRFS